MIPLPHIFFRMCRALQVNLVSQVSADILITMSLSCSTSHSSSSCSSGINAPRCLVKAADVGCRHSIDRHPITRCQTCHTGARLSVWIGLDRRSSGLSIAQRPLGLPRISEYVNTFLFHYLNQDTGTLLVITDDLNLGISPR